MQLGAIAITVANERLAEAADWLVDSGWSILETIQARGINKLSEQTMIVMPADTCQVGADIMRRRVERAYWVAK